MKRAFTIADLLCVIAIIIILAALLFPLVRSAVREATLRDASNRLRQSGLALIIYANEHDGLFPTTSQASAAVPKSVQCHPLDTWTPACQARSVPLMLGSWGYVPSLKPTPTDSDFCLLANVFSAHRPPAQLISTPLIDLDDPCIINETCFMPDLVEYITYTGSLLKIKRPVRQPRQPGPYLIFGWGKVFHDCPVSTASFSR